MMETTVFAPVALVTLLAVIEVYVFAIRVGKARGAYEVPAPRMDGPEEFLRIHRIHQNTVEQMVVFIPLLWMSALMWKPLVAAGLGLVFVIARVLYAAGYAKAAEKRSVGFALGFFANVGLAVTVLIGIAKAYL